MPQDFIVTGGAGFIGSNIVSGLNSRGLDNIIIVDNLHSAPKKSNLADLKYRDYIDKKDFRKMFLGGRAAKCSTVFHMGACSSTMETDEDYLIDNNFIYTRQLCEWCLKNSTRFIYASSAATYGDGSLGYSDDHTMVPSLKPMNLYARSKQLFDMWALQNGILDRIAGIKFFNVFGPREDHKGEMRSVVNKAFEQVRINGEIKLFKSYRSDYADGEQKRDFVYVKDAVNVCLFFHDRQEISGIYNCGTGRARTWLDLARSVFSAMNVRPNISFIEMPGEIREKYQYFTQADTAKLRSAGYTKEFTTLENAVPDYAGNRPAGKISFDQRGN